MRVSGSQTNGGKIVEEADESAYHTRVERSDAAKVRVLVPQNDAVMTYYESNGRIDNEEARVNDEDEHGLADQERHHDAEWNKQDSLTLQSDSDLDEDDGYYYVQPEGGVQVSCQSCHTHLGCNSNAHFVICPVCQGVTPVLANAAASSSAGEHFLQKQNHHYEMAADQACHGVAGCDGAVTFADVLVWMMEAE